MKQKVWLITGVSKGLGREIAKQVAATNDIVLGTVRNMEDKEDFEGSFGTKAFIIDLSQTDQIKPLTDYIIKEYGHIDVLVNNAGYGTFGMIEEFEKNEIINHFNVNLIAVWKLCQSVLPSMRTKGTGTIVQISSRLGILAGVGNGIYAAGKFALEGMSEALKLEIEPFGVKVLLVEPGGMRTDFFGGSIAYAQNEIPAYAEKLGNIRANTKSLNGKQPGNPVKAAHAIIDAVNNGVPSFRLPLTSGAIATMKTKITELQCCVASMASTALSVDY
jgi:short-subunit dehydrogenase